MRDGDGLLNYELGMLQPNRPEVAGPDAPFLPPLVGVRVTVGEAAGQRVAVDLPMSSTVWSPLAPADTRRPAGDTP